MGRRKVNIPWNAGIRYKMNFNRVVDKFLDNEEHIDSLIKNRPNIGRLEERLVKKSALRFMEFQGGMHPTLELNGGDAINQRSRPGV